MSQLKLTVISDPSRFRAGMNAVQKDLFKLQKTANSVGKGMNKALSAVGLAAGFTALASTLQNSAKAASEDIKSQALLKNALQNTIGATDATVAAAEGYIKKTQLSSAVLDDELRPALAKTVLATGSLASGQKLLNTALNVSAGTGKSLDVVTSALSKAWNGNTTSLKKLIPGLDTAGNLLGTLDEKFAGAAETAANNDPYQRLQVIFADLQETIGTTLLPAIQQFSEYLASPEGQQNIQQIAEIFKAIGVGITNATTFLLQNMGVVKAVIGVVATLKLGWVLITGAVKLYTMATKIASLETKALRTALITTGIGALIVAVGFLAEAWINATSAADDYKEPVVETGDPYVPGETLGPGLGPNGEPWLVLGYNSYEEYKQAQADAKQKIIDANAAKLKAIREALAKEIKKMKTTGEKFRDAVGLAFGTFGKDENSVFNIDYVIAKMRRVAEAAKGFAENIKKLREKGATSAVTDQLIAMGPAQGNIVAKGLLASGSKLSEFLGLQKTLYSTGTQVQAQANLTPNATYEININKAVISAADIIKEIRILEKKTGRKYLVN